MTTLLRLLKEHVLAHAEAALQIVCFLCAAQLAGAELLVDLWIPNSESDPSNSKSDDAIATCLAFIMLSSIVCLDEV